MAIKARGEVASPNDQINLTVDFKDGYGVLTDPTTFPTISIIQPNGSVLMAPTSAGVSKIAVGKYSYTFTVPYNNNAYGVYNDVWVGSVGTNRVEAVFSFIVNYSEVQMLGIDGYHSLGEDPGFNYSQTAIMNINKLLKTLRARLNSSGKSKRTDAYGNTVYLTCDIFSVDTLVTFLATALSDFNQVPYFTAFTFEDSEFIAQFLEVLVEGATLYSLASKALIERGAEFTISDNSLQFQPPTVSDMLNTQHGALITHYWEKLKFIKNSMRPAPKGLGILGMTNGLNPRIRNLANLRARRFF
jgi:hypothetical protein